MLMIRRRGVGIDATWAATTGHFRRRRPTAAMVRSDPVTSRWLWAARLSYVPESLRIPTLKDHIIRRERNIAKNIASDAKGDGTLKFNAIRIGVDRLPPCPCPRQVFTREQLRAGLIFERRQIDGCSRYIWYEFRRITH